MASTVPYGGDEFLREFERADQAGRPEGRVDLSRACRAAIRTTMTPCRSSSSRSELDVPVVIHPPSVGFGEERMQRLSAGIQRRPSDGRRARGLAR